MDMIARWKHTDINRIGLVKRTGDEWAIFTKEFVLAEKPVYAVFRAESNGVCGIYINGEFVETSIGRLPDRVTCIEVTSFLKAGKNTVALKLGDHYFQHLTYERRERRGFMVSFISAELKYDCGCGEKTICTDETWKVDSDDGQTVPEILGQVTKMEYQQFWMTAYEWHEKKPTVIPEAVLKVAGKEYEEYAVADEPVFDEPQCITDTNMVQRDGGLFSCVSNIASQYTYDPSGLPYVIFDFGRITVGYVEFEYESDEDGEAILDFEYTESPDDFKKISGIVQNLQLHEKMAKGTGFIRVLRRRASRYFKITFPGQYRSTGIRNFRIRRSLAPVLQKGWFRCEEDVLNRAWEVGKYTLHVNKHQEYESCPRNEMKFFSGDGIVDALIDYYAFGDLEMTPTNLAFRFSSGNNGIAYEPLERNIGLWDYRSWRNLMVMNHYLYTGDVEFLKTEYPIVKKNIEWLTERMGNNGLIYQLPVFDGTFATHDGAVEYTCGFDRLGEKTYLNALFYKSVRDAAEMARIVGDSIAEEWDELADFIKAAYNARLWSEKDGAYIDPIEPGILPQDGNALAVLFGVAEGERAKRTMDTLKARNWSPYGSPILDTPVLHTRGGNKTISPAMNMHESVARCLIGNSEDGIELIRRCWGAMLKKGAQTFWEFTANNGTDRWPIPAHAWAGGPAYLLSAFGLGIRPETPGYGKMRFEPYVGFEKLNGVVPTVKGLVAVSGRVENGIRKYEIALPVGIELNAKLPEGAVLEEIRY